VYFAQPTVAFGLGFHEWALPILAQAKLAFFGARNLWALPIPIKGCAPLKPQQRDVAFKLDFPAANLVVKRRSCEQFKTP
jgi:hypothetical protein